jgi:glycosyltransferase involved in cell wall biosynthesis
MVAGIGVGAATLRVVTGPSLPWRIVLFISNLDFNGGAEVQAIDLARELKERGWQVTVVSMLEPGSSVGATLAGEGIRVRTLGTLSLASAPRSLWRLSRILAEERPHILHCHMAHAVLAARAIRLVRPIPVMITTLHGLKMYNVRGTGWRLREFVNRCTEWLSDRTTVVCEAAARRYVASGAVSGRSLRQIPNGVDIDRFQFDATARKRVRAELGLRDEFAWLMVGRFQPVKDHHTMLRAFARVAPRSPKSVLLLAGDGPLRAELTELAQALSIGSQVRFLGPRADVPALMSAADAFVMSSLFEALPMVLLEAGACGLPAVATDVGGVSEVVIDGQTGLLAPPNHPETLAHTMLRLMALDVETRLNMGAEARAHIERNYRLDRVTSQWERLYHDLLTANEVRP